MEPAKDDDDSSPTDAAAIMRLPLILLLFLKVSSGVFAHQLPERSGATTNQIVMDNEFIKKLIKSVFPPTTTVKPYDEDEECFTENAPSESLGDSHRVARQEHNPPPYQQPTNTQHFQTSERHHKYERHEEGLPSSNFGREQAQGYQSNLPVRQVGYQKVTKENIPGRQNEYQQWSQQYGQNGYQQHSQGTYQNQRYVQGVPQQSEQEYGTDRQTVAQKLPSQYYQPASNRGSSVSYQPYLQGGNNAGQRQGQLAQGIPQRYVPRNTYQQQGALATEEDNGQTPTIPHQSEQPNSNIQQRPFPVHLPAMQAGRANTFQQQYQNTQIPPQRSETHEHQQTGSYHTAGFRRPVRQPEESRYPSFYDSHPPSSIREHNREEEEEDTSASGPQQQTSRRVQAGGVSMIRMPPSYA